MIEFMSSWVKGLGLAIVIISILEMLLPNNKTKKYIRMVMGIYVLFTMFSPFLSNQQIGNIEQINLEKYTTSEVSSSLNQSSKDERIEELYEKELEKDIVKKLKEKGYEATNCKVKAQISDKEEETKIIKIKVKMQKLSTEENRQKEQGIENQIVMQMQKIKPIDTSIKKTNDIEQEENKSKKIQKSDIQNIKKFFIEEYGVSEKCLEIS